MLDRSFTTVLDAGFDDVDQLCSTVRLWDLDFQPLQSGTAPGSVARVIQGGTRRFDCAYARILLNIDQRGAPPPGKITFTIPGRQLDAIWWQGQATTANDILVYFPGTEMKSLTGNDFEVHLISLTEGRHPAVGGAFRIDTAAACKIADRLQGAGRAHRGGPAPSGPDAQRSAGH